MFQSKQSIGRLAGLLWLVVMVTTGYHLIYVRTNVVQFTDPTATFENLKAFEQLFRWGIASSIVSEVILVIFGLVIYKLFRDVSRNISLIALIGTILHAAMGLVSSMMNYGALAIATGERGLGALFSPEQAIGLAYFMLRLNNFGVGLFELFSAFYMIAIGLLILKSGYVPKILGLLLILGGVMFPINTFTKLIAYGFYPAEITQLTMMMNAAGGPLTMLWLIIWGARETQTESISND